MRLLVILLSGYFIVQLATTQVQAITGPRPTRQVEGQENNVSQWSPQKTVYRRPYIQRVWLPTPPAKNANQFRSNHSQNIRTFAYTINDTSKFLRFLKEEESKIGLDMKNNASGRQFNKFSKSDVDADGSSGSHEDYSSNMESSLSLENTFPQRPTTVATTTAATNQRRYRPMTRRTSQPVVNTPSPSTASPVPSTTPFWKKYWTTTRTPVENESVEDESDEDSVLPVTSTSTPKPSVVVPKLPRRSYQTINGPSLNRTLEITTHPPYREDFDESYFADPRRYGSNRDTLVNTLPSLRNIEENTVVQEKRFPQTSIQPIIKVLPIFNDTRNLIKSPRNSVTYVDSITYNTTPSRRQETSENMLSLRDTDENSFDNEPQYPTPPNQPSLNKSLLSSSNIPATTSSTSTPYRVVYVNAYSTDPNRYHIVTPVSESAEIVAPLTPTELSTTQSSSSVYIQYPVNYVDSYATKPRRYHVIHRESKMFFPTMADTTVAPVHDYPTRRFEQYSVTQKRYHTITAAHREASRYLTLFNDTQQFDSTTVSSTSVPFPEQYINPYVISLKPIQNIASPSFENPSKYPFNATTTSASSHTQRYESPYIDTYSATTKRYRNRDSANKIMDQFNERQHLPVTQISSSSSASFYDPFSTNLQRYQSTVQPRREHSVKVISSYNTTQYYPRTPVISYIEEPYAKHDQTPSTSSRGTSGNIVPIFNDTKPVPSTAFPYPIPYIEAPYYVRQNDRKQSSSGSKRRSKSSRRRNRKHRRRGHRNFNTYGVLMAPSLALQPPVGSPLEGGIFGFDPSHVQQSRFNVVEGRKHRDSYLEGIATTEHPRPNSPPEKHRHYSVKRGPKALQSDPVRDDVEEKQRRQSHTVRGVQKGLEEEQAARGRGPREEVGELRLLPAETKYYRRRQLSMQQLIMGGVTGDQGSIPGVPGKDYPTYNHPPLSGFNCLNMRGRRGYFADRSTRCQVFYICPGDGRGEPMLCPNGTVFNQDVFVCDWWFNVDCGSA